MCASVHSRYHSDSENIRVYNIINSLNSNSYVGHSIKTETKQLLFTFSSDVT